MCASRKNNKKALKRLCPFDSMLNSKSKSRYHPKEINDNMKTFTLTKKHNWFNKECENPGCCS